MDETSQQLLQELETLRKENQALQAAARQQQTEAEQSQQALLTGLNAIVEAADELLSCQDVDSLCRRAVELGRAKFGLERCSLYLLEKEETQFRGTYGTNDQGETIEEHLLTFPKDDYWNRQFKPYRSSERAWMAIDQRQSYWDGEKIVFVGEGWVVHTPIESQATQIGIFFNDKAISKKPLDEAQQEIIAVYASLLGQIIERKRAEEALIESEERWRRMSEAAFEGIAFTNGDRVVDVNSTFADMLGYEVSEMVGKPVSAFVAPESLEKILARIQAGTEGAYECLVQHRNGTLIPVESQAKLLPYRGSTIRVTAIRDITERKRLQEQLLQSQKMESIGRLAGGIAHDFNNLLTAILGYTELAEEHLPLADPSHAYLTHVRQAALRATNLTTQLLAFARKQVIEPQVIDLNILVTEMYALLDRLIGEDIELTMLPGADLWRVRIDPGQFEQILVNLVVNARDAMPEGGKITIEIANVRLEEDYTRLHTEITPGEYVMLAVSDTGNGMDEITRKNIFEPFFTTKALGKGTGLGLATCHGIVKQNGGHIWVYSELGQGTIFKIYLPRVQEDASGPTISPTLSPPRGSETLLLVEDEPMVRSMAEAALRAQGYQVLVAGLGSEAILLAQEYGQTIHLLVTDVVMPEMSGKQLAERLSALRPDMKVLYTSGYTDNTIVHHGVLDMGVAFLQKPYLPSTLARKVRETLDKS